MRIRAYRWIMLVLMAGIGIGLIWISTTSRESSYEGVPLRAWLMDLDDQHPGPKYEKAKEAFRQMGERALPELLRILEWRDYSWKGKIRSWAVKHHLMTGSGISTKDEQRQAVLACQALGPVAKPAIPALVALLSGGDFSAPGYIGMALVLAGPEAIAPLATCLTNSAPGVRTEAVIALGDFRTNQDQVVPILSRCVRDPDSYVRSQAVSALGYMDQHVAEVLTVLLEALRDNDSQVRWLACIAIGNFKERGRAAREKLIAALEDSDPSVKAAAAVALIEVDCVNETTVGIAMPQIIAALDGLEGLKPSGIPRVDKRLKLNFRYPAIKALAACGRAGRAAIPALIDCFSDDEDYVRKAATNALEKIDPAGVWKNRR